MLDLVQANLLSPMPLAFGLGLCAAVARSDLRIPEEIHATLSLYLLFAIGLKGGASLADASFAAIVGPLVAVLLLGSAIPLWSYGVLRRILGMSRVDAAALAAHYGSVSAVTFIAATTMLAAAGIGHEGFLPALVAVFEVPAILVAIWLGRRGQGGGGMGVLMHELMAGKVTLMLVGGLAIGWMSGPDGVAKVKPFFIDPFNGVLVLFLLELGRVAGLKLADIPKAGVGLIAFAIVMPLIHGAAGVWAGTVAGLSPGGAFLIGTLAASASYIAAPAAVRLALPEANPAYYLTMSLAVTFPFNLAVGIPAYLWFARTLAG